MEFIERIDRFHKTTVGHAIFAVFELILLYIFISISIDTASMWAYLMSLILAAGVIQNIIALVKLQQKGNKKSGKRR